MNALPPLRPGLDRPSTPDNTAFLSRLATFFEENNADVSKWPRSVPTPGDMAGAGFTYNPNGTWMDNVHCDSCELECFKWENRDNPYKQHSENVPECEYVNSETFAEFHAKFKAKKRNRAALAVASGGRGRGRRKIALSEIQVVADLEPIAVVVATPEPMRIHISGGGVNMNLTVNETPTKKRRHN